MKTEKILSVEKSIIREVIEKGNIIINEGRDPIIDYKGNKLYHLISYIPIKDKTGKLLGALEVLTDITELRKGEELNKQIIRKIPYPVYMIFVDVDKKIRCVNEDFIKFIKTKSIDDTIGKNINDVFDNSDINSFTETVIDSKEPIFNKKTVLKNNGIDGAKEGHIHVLASCVPIKNEMDELIGALEVFTDITEQIQLNKLLKESEELIHNFFKAIPYPSKILFVDTKCKIKYANDEFAKFAGFEKGEDIIGKEPEEILGVEKSIIREVIEKGNIIINKRRDPVIDHKGNKLYHLISCLPIKNETDTLLGAIGVLTDITELRKGEELIKQIIRKVPHPVYIIYIDVDKKIQYISEELIKFTKTKSIDDTIGKNIDDVFDDSSMKKSLIKTVIDSKEPIFNKKTVLKNNEINGAKENYIYVLASCVPIKNEMDELIGALEVFTDITEQNQLNKLLKESEERYRLLIESTDTSIYMVDRKCNYLFANEQYLSRINIQKDEILGKNFEEFHSKKETNEFNKLIDSVFKIGKSIQQEYTSHWDNKRFLRTLSPIKNKKGEIESIIVISKDIDILIEKDKMREDHIKEIEKKNKEMEHFAYTISHDLRSPLITIQGFVNMLQHDLKQNNIESTKNYLEYINNSVRKMDELLTDILKLSRSGHIIEAPINVPFNEIVNNALEQLTVQIKSNNVNISVDKKFPIVCVDKTRIVEVMVNLIENGIKYKGDEKFPKIEIGSRIDNGNRVFFVKDNGIGIEKSQHEKVFELFYRLYDNGKGTGAGLAIVKRIIKAHGGNVWIESDGIKGTTVCFTLPLENKGDVNKNLKKI